MGWGVSVPSWFFLCMAIEVCAGVALFTCGIALLRRSVRAISTGIVASAVIVLQHVVLLTFKSHALEAEFLNSSYTVMFWILPIILAIACIISLLLARQMKGWLSDQPESPEISK
jgi:hypothetical protein